MTSTAPAAEPSPPQTPVEVRSRLVEALRLDLVGPWSGHPLETESLRAYPQRVRPSNWYLTGFIVPPDSAASEAHKAELEIEASDDVDETPEQLGTAEESADEGKVARRGYFPSSIGLSFLIDGETRELPVTVRWGDYVPEEIDKAALWSRMPREASTTIRIPATVGSQDWQVANSNGLVLHTVVRPVGSALLETGDTGAQSVSVFLLNRRKQPAGELVDEDTLYAFQPEIEVRCDRPLPSRPVVRSSNSTDWDEEVADLHYADAPEYATGHGVSADWEVTDGECRVVRTAWIGQAEVEATSTASVDGVELSMQALGLLDSSAAVRSALDPLVAEYRDWIQKKKAGSATLDGRHKETAEELLRLAGIAADRIEHGINVLASDSDALDAFRVANRAVARALTQRLEIQDPAWRPFQLAFILLNLPGIADPSDSHRQTVDLLFFPTGGGKTEAYLGLAAISMVLRRLRNPGSQGHAAGGVCVVMRYTLRLLTLDQLSRASGLVCALELEREKDSNRYGAWPFEIGLWVGTAATPNRMGAKGDSRRGTARSKVHAFKSDPASNPSPIPLEECPWCGEKFEQNSFALLPDSDRPNNLRVICPNFECNFCGDCALPVVAVDEPLYRRLPAFLVATVDKFASLPWTGRSGTLLGGADRYDEHGFYGPCDPGVGTPLATPLKPPDLIIQDELHLISGPLGTMAGLYETVIEALAVQNSGAHPVRPKIVASTATVRQADKQIQALFARPQTQIFPPPGPDRRDSFFARTAPVSEKAARLYLGISAQGRSAKVVTRRVLVALMGAAMRAYLDAGGDANEDNPADPYMTVIGYFNALRELGGGRRILEEEVQNTIKRIGLRRRHEEVRGLFRDRFGFSEVVELTSRVSTAKVAEARRLLGNQFRIKVDDKHARSVDCAIATNMISVGLDIPRLGLMTVVGQPKTAAEYIQATSRVGRDADRPGLVVTLLNMHKPRDRSHYERFKHFHQTFYRSVEVASVTPFAARALDRGLAGALVALARQSISSMTPPKGAAAIIKSRAELAQLLQDAFSERIRNQPSEWGGSEQQEQLSSVRNRIEDLLDAWCRICSDATSEGPQFQYQKYERSGSGNVLLRDMMDDTIEDETRRKFRANRSLRDVEPDVCLALIES